MKRSKGIDLTSATWRKSTYSNAEGGECIEVSDDFLTTATWRKSSYSNGDGADCIEVVDTLPGLVPVRDSKDPHGPALVFPVAGWSAFVGAVKNGQLPGA
ncbi:MULTISPECIES: DUF397 domain-containing protein [Streptomyces]|uniref:DUF397 domain-containing protein n=1 Tax=Streptomyces TaxID=1883 RepID=UPI0019626D13|nr:MULTISPECIES: DUF397 domain-containing protein [Streptomyces]QRX93610.1 DUF397 domain-containing protein [Streptomyces noursei]UJB43286.1 DUF397 domain-containing protein [Streptomyces sp. A1-5]